MRNFGLRRTCICMWAESCHCTAEIYNFVVSLKIALNVRATTTSPNRHKKKRTSEANAAKIENSENCFFGWHIFDVGWRHTHTRYCEKKNCCEKMKTLRPNAIWWIYYFIRVYEDWPKPHVCVWEMYVCFERAQRPGRFTRRSRFAPAHVWRCCCFPIYFSASSIVLLVATFP